MVAAEAFAEERKSRKNAVRKKKNEAHSALDRIVALRHCSFATAFVLGIIFLNLSL